MLKKIITSLRQKIIKYIIFRVISALLFVSIVDRLSNYLINDLYFNTPRTTIYDHGNLYSIGYLLSTPSVFIMILILCVLLYTEYLSVKKTKIDK